MPEGHSHASAEAASAESRAAKRARLAFNRDDMDLDPVKTPEYERWERWRDHAAATAYGFLDSADAGVMAAQYQERLMEDGLSVAGVDRAVEWAGGGLDAPTALIYMALFEHSTDRRPQRRRRGQRPPRHPSPSRPLVEQPTAAPQQLPVPRQCPESRRPVPAPEAPKHPGGCRRDGAAERLEMQLAVARCARCGLDWNDHVETAAHHMGRSLKAPADDVLSLFQAWWAESIKWAVVRPAWKERAAAADLALAEEALHLLVGGEIPLDGGSSTRLNDQSRVTVELAARGLGDAGVCRYRRTSGRTGLTPCLAGRGGVSIPCPPPAAHGWRPSCPPWRPKAWSAWWGGMQMRRCSSSGKRSANALSL